MELGGGGESATKIARLSSDDAAAAAGEDRLSALPIDVLVLILLKLSTRAAAQTSLLSRSWRRVWALLRSSRRSASTKPPTQAGCATRSMATRWPSAGSASGSTAPPPRPSP